MMGEEITVVCTELQINGFSLLPNVCRLISSMSHARMTIKNGP